MARGPNGEIARKHYYDGAPIEIRAPAEQTVPLVFSSPHSGSRYDPAFIEASKLDEIALRRSEDSFVDEIFCRAPDFGAPLLCALYPRAYLDPNREAYELDPAMFSDVLPAHAMTRTERVRAGFGTIARLVATGAEIYSEKLSFAEAEARIEVLYRPYHAALRRLISETTGRFGWAVLIDCHSMPSVGGPADRDKGRRRADFVLGDRFGTSCASALTGHVEKTLQELGYTVARNDPYAGAYTTVHYGRPENGVHALQIEVNRGLYMNEADFTRSPGHAPLQEALGKFIEGLAAFERSRLPRG